MISTIRSCVTATQSQCLLTRPLSSLHSQEITGASEVRVRAYDVELSLTFIVIAT